MTADLFFHNVEFYDAPSGQRIRVLMGNPFTFRINDRPEGAVIATTQKDNVLRLVEGDDLSRVVAQNIGISEIQVQTADRQVPFYITVEVFGHEAQGFKIPEPTIEPKP